MENISSYKDHRDGQIYKTIKFGNQIWLAQNFNFFIEEESRTKPWQENAGKLYSFNAAIKNCPPGWHLPSEQEYLKLVTTICNKRKEDLTQREIYDVLITEERMFHWGHHPNSSGFNAILCGYREFDLFSNEEELSEDDCCTHFWTSTLIDEDKALILRIDGNIGEATFARAPLKLGCSVRYIHD